MALLLFSNPSFLYKNPNTPTLRFFPHKPNYLSFSLLPSSPIPTIRFSSTIRFSGDPPSRKPLTPESSDEDEESDGSAAATFVDEWEEKAGPEAEPSTNLSDSDPPNGEGEDESGVVGAPDEFVVAGNGTAAVDVDGEDNKLGELKRCLVDTLYGTDLGFRASTEVRAEVLELVAKLEAANPTPAPTEAVELLDGNWVLLYTAFSELLPLLAAGTTPLLKVEKICQSINTSSLTIENSTTLSNLFATFSFSATATFEVRSPSRIQVQFKEGSVPPPEIKSSVNLPENVDIFGQTINLSSVQQSLNPLQESVAGIARAISGQPPLKIPVPGERTKSWLLITYLDKDFRISRGDGGLFVLAKEGSPLLDQ